MTELQDLLLRGMRGFFPASDREILDEVARGMKTGEYKVFTAKLADKKAAFCILSLPKNPLDNPQVLHFYSEHPALRRALVKRTLDFVKDKGYNKLIAINGSKLPDDTWVRTFKHEGWKINPVKTVFEFEVVK